MVMMGIHASPKSYAGRGGSYVLLSEPSEKDRKAAVALHLATILP